MEVAPLLGDPEPESSDSSDDFAGAESADDTDEEDGTSLSKGKRQKSSLPQQRTPAPTPTKKTVKNNNVNRRPAQTPKKSTKTSKRAANTPTPATPKRGKAATVKAPASKTKYATPPTRKTKQLPTPARSGQKAKPRNVAAVESTGSKKAKPRKSHSLATAKPSCPEPKPLLTQSKAD